jgi:hypothetical protein
MGGGASAQQRDVIIPDKQLEENEMVNSSVLWVPLYKGSPATLTTNMYTIGYKIGE